MKKILLSGLILATTHVFAQPVTQNQGMPRAGISTTINPEKGFALPQPLRVNPNNVKAGANPPPGAKPIAPPSRIPPVGGPPLPKNTPVKTNVEKRLLECSKAPSGEKLNTDEISTCMSKKGFKKSKDQHIKENVPKASTNPASTVSAVSKPELITSSEKTTTQQTSQYKITPMQPNFKK